MEKALLQPEILTQLSSSDMLRLCQTNKSIQEQCQREDFWEILNSAKFGPAISSLCPKEIYLIKSFIRENDLATEQLLTALNEENFHKFEQLLQLGVKPIPNETFLLIGYFSLANIKIVLDLLQKYKFDLNTLIPEMFRVDSFNPDLIIEMIKRGADFVADKAYFTIIQVLFQEMDDIDDQFNLAYLTQILDDPRVDVNELNEYENPLLTYVIDNKAAVELLLARGADTSLVQDHILEALDEMEL